MIIKNIIKKQSKMTNYFKNKYKKILGNNKIKDINEYLLKKYSKLFNVDLFNINYKKFINMDIDKTYSLKELVNEINICDLDGNTLSAFGGEGPLIRVERPRPLDSNKRAREAFIPDGAFGSIEGNINITDIDISIDKNKTKINNEKSMLMNDEIEYYINQNKTYIHVIKNLINHQDNMLIKIKKDSIEKYKDKSKKEQKYFRDNYERINLYIYNDTITPLGNNYNDFENYYYISYIFDMYKNYLNMKKINFYVGNDKFSLI